MKFIIYIICHNEESEQKAKTQYAKYGWAKPLRMDDTIYMESWTHINHLEHYEKEWELNNIDYVGTLTHSAYTKILIPHLDKMINQIQNYDVIPFITTTWDTITQMNICHKGMLDIIKDIFAQTEYKNTDLESKFSFHPCNYWMIKTKYMKEYIKFINRFYEIMETNNDIKPRLFENFNGYIGVHLGKNSILKNKVSHISEEKKIEKFGQNSYSFHCFIYERLPSIFFYMKNLKIYNYTQTILNFLENDNFFFKKITEKTEGHEIIKYTDYEVEGDDGIVYVIYKRNADGYPDIICNGDATKLTFWDNFMNLK